MAKKRRKKAGKRKTSRRKGGRKKASRRGGHIPLNILEKRLVKLHRIVKSRGGKAKV